MNVELGAAEIARRVRAREVSPVEVAEQFLAQIDRLDPSLHAWESIDADAVMRLASQRKDQAPLGPLHGVPVGVKDIFFTKGLRTTMGSPIFKGFVPDHSATVVERLEKAGAMVLGKTVTTEFSAFDPARTRNPWNVGHTPGGSSSGSASAVAAAMCPAALGSQTVASVGRPAVYCGIVGFVPTCSLVPRKGIYPMSWSLDHVGAFTRSVEDMAVLFEVLAASSRVSSRTDPTFRVGVVRGFFEEKTEPDAWKPHEQLIADLGQAGVAIVELPLPPVFDLALGTLRTIMRAELSSVHERLHARHANQYSPRIRGLVESGLLLSSGDYLRALRIRVIYQREMLKLFSQCDVILSPGARGPAPRGLDHTGDPIISAPWTLADFPTLSLPLTLDGNGLPLGIQVSAPPKEDNFLLEVGRWLERLVGFDARPDLTD